MDYKPKIFGIGLPRTGTTSLNQALKILGYKSFDHPILLYNNFDETFIEKYDALVDSPIPLIYKDLDLRYPGSKFILTTRSLDSWIESMEWLYEHGSAKWYTSEKIYSYRKEFLGTEKYNKTTLKNKFIDYHNDVNNYFSKREDDLLVIDVLDKDKFKSLCNFLGLEQVEIEYPRSNERTNIHFLKRLFFHHVVRNAKKFVLYFYKR